MGNEPLAMDPCLLLSDDVVLGRCIYTLVASEVDVVEAVNSTSESELPAVVHNTVSNDDVILGGCMYTLVKSAAVVVKSIDSSGALGVGDSIADEWLVSG